MELHRTDEGFALYKEKTQIGFCALTPAAKGAAITAFGIEPQWRRKGYGSYLLKETLRAYAGYDREKATAFSAPLPPPNAPRCGFFRVFFGASSLDFQRRGAPFFPQNRACPWAPQGFPWPFSEKGGRIPIGLRAERTATPCG